jgi:hypothetical protein
MPASPELVAFISGNFRSVWTLELLLFLKANADRSWDNAPLVTALRASEAVVSQGLATLLAGALIVEDADGARYAPASDDLRRRIDEIEELYARKPDAVRRMIVLAPRSGLSAFADSFRLRKD